MDSRAQAQLWPKRVPAASMLVVLALMGCAPPDHSETILPNSSETCGGTAIPTRYIVHYHSGAWDYIENHDREDFKNSYVRPRLDAIDFIEYDQTLKVNSEVHPALSTGIDNWGVSATDAPAAWQRDLRGQGAVVAVIDSGVDVTHQQLVSQIAYNEGEAGEKKSNGVDDDGNGFVDDYEGYNFVDNNGSVEDDVGHGTHVSGIIAASHTDTTHRTGYPQGLAPSAKILPVKTLSRQSGTLSAALKGIDYAVARGANIINASWGGPGCSQSLRQKVSEATRQNVLFIVAAGNSGNNLDRAPEYPAAFRLPLQITVGAIRASLSMDSYSNYSRSLVHLFAPGTMVVSTTPGNTVSAMSGTSMAAPFVSGAAALLMSRNPNLSTELLRDALLGSVDFANEYMNITNGRLNIAKAADALGL